MFIGVYRRPIMISSNRLLPLLARRGRPAHLVDLVEVDLAAFVHGLIGKNHRHRIGHADFQIGLGRLTVAAAIEEALQLRVHGIALLFLHHHAPAGQPAATRVAPATNAFFFSAALVVSAASFGGSRYHQAIGGWPSAPTVISTVPSVPIMISPISARPALKYGRKLFVLTDE